MLISNHLYPYCCCYCDYDIRVVTHPIILVQNTELTMLADASAGCPSSTGLLDHNKGLDCMGLAVQTGLLRACKKYSFQPSLLQCLPTLSNLLFLCIK